MSEQLLRIPGQKFVLNNMYMYSDMHMLLYSI